MRLFSYFSLAVCFVGLSGWADTVPETASFSSLPLNSVIRLRTPLEVPAKGRTVNLPQVFADGDGDLVPDYQDWCPATPPGARVWTVDDLPKNPTVRPEHVGCSGPMEKGWIYEEKNLDKTPSGSAVSCRANFIPSLSPRVLPAKLALTLIDPLASSTSKESSLAYYYSTVDRNFREDWPWPPTFSTPAGTQFWLSCDALALKTKRTSWESAYQVFTTASNVATIADLKKAFDVTVAPEAPAVQITRN